MSRTIGTDTLAWAIQQLRRELQLFGDDPFGYSAAEEGNHREYFQEDWNRLKALGNDLGVDTVGMMKEISTDYELMRLSQLIGEKIA